MFEWKPSHLINHKAIAIAWSLQIKYGQDPEKLSSDLITDSIYIMGFFKALAHGGKDRVKF
ncbi:MAG: hypothetical protein ACTSPN_06060 [Promethearchaeota archaeon]